MAKSKIRKISSSVYQIDLGAVNCYLIEEPNGLTLVDAGYKGDDTKIYAALAHIGKQPADIKHIVLTHLHADHSGAAADIQKKLKIPVYASPEDGLQVSKGVSMRQNTKTTKGIMNSILKKIFVKNIETVKAIDGVIFLKDNQVLPFGNGLVVYNTPGHSLGHIALLVKGDSLLIAGDLCANNLGLSPSIVNEDPDSGIQTIKKLSEIDFTKACFGHGKPILKDAKSKLIKKFGSDATNPVI